MEATIEAVAQTITLVQQASALDFTGETEHCLAAYGAAAARLEEVALYMPAEQAETLRRNAEEIKRRMEILRRERARKEQKTTYPQFPVQFVPQPVPIEEFVVPQDVLLRPFWLAKVLRSSMQGGAFITPALYVSRDVWHQDGASTALAHIHTKSRFLSNWCDAIAPLRSVHSLGNLATVSKVLDTFIATVGKLNSTFGIDVGRSRKEGAVSSKLGKGMWDLLQRGQNALRSWKNQEADYELCLVWAVNMLEQVQLLERWIVYFRQAESSISSTCVLERLGTVSILLYTGPCGALLQDMMLLVQRYQEKSRKSVSRFLPVDVKIVPA